MTSETATARSAHGLVFRTDICASDAAAVRDMAAATGFFRSDEVDIAVELVTERLSKGDASGYHFVFLDDEKGEPVGYACFGPIACTIGSFDLYWIVVTPRMQGRRIGQMLMREAERRASAMGARRLYIETSSQPKYVPTRAFYEKAGYRLDARLEDFYAPGDDKLIYVRELAAH